MVVKLVLILVPLVGYMVSDWNIRHQARAIEMSRLEIKLVITGNVFFEDGLPAKDTVITVDGIDRKRETDENGWFQIEVNNQEEWIVRARYGDQTVQATVAKDNTQKPLRLSIKRVPERELAARTPPLDSNLLALLDIEKEHCRERNVAFLTPNLLFALIAVRTSPVRRIFDQACTEKSQNIVEGLLRYRSSEINSTTLPFAEFDWYERADVQAARRRAKQEAKASIDARHLLLGFLETESETRIELQRTLGNEGFDRLVHAAETANLRIRTPGVSNLFTSPAQPPDSGSV